MRTGFVGRERESAVLADCLGAALRGHPRVVLCRGEPGIGKTRLAEELVTVAASQGVHAVWGLAVEAAGAPPYWPWRQVLRAIGHEVDLQGIAEKHRLSADLARLVPDLFAGSGAGAADGGSHEDRFRLFEAVTRLLRHMTRSRPMLIVLDDAHWADPSSLLLLQHVARTMDGHRLLILVNHRDTEPLHGVLLTELGRGPATTELDLRGLAVPAVGRQLAAVVGTDLADSEVERVHARTGGNPFFVGEVGRALADRGAGTSEAPVTGTVREAIGARLHRLAPTTVRLLRAASIVGRRFPVAVVAPMVDAPVQACLVALDEAVAAGLLVAVTTAPGEHVFVHDLVRDAVEAGLATTERVRLHRTAAAAVETVHAGRLEPHLSDLARHWAVAAVAGERARAVEWIRRAAQEAMRRLACEEGARLYRLALTVGDTELDDLTRCRLLLAVGGALKLAGEVPGRVQACQDATGLARSLGRPDLLAEAVLVLEGGDAGLDDDQTLRTLCEEALAALGPEPTPLRAVVTAKLSDACMYLGDLDAAGSASERALVIADRSGDHAAMTAALRARQLVRSGPDGVEERSTLAERILAIGRDDRNPATRLWGHLWRIDVAFQRGDLTAVTRELEVLTRCVDEVRGPVARWHLLQCRAVLAQAQARFDDARALADRALAALPPSATGHQSAVTNRDGVLFTVGLHAGLGPDADGFLAAPGCGTLPGEEAAPASAGVIFAIVGAHQLASRGRLREATTVYRRLGSPATWQPIPHVVTVCYAVGIATAVALNLPDDVATLRDLLARFRGQHVVSGAGCVAYNGPVELYLGIAAAHLDLLEDAVADLEEAAKACAANGAAGFLVEAHLELAAALARRDRPGDRRRVGDLVADCLHQAGALGMAPFVTRAEALAGRPDRGPTAPLTPREREVAELVAQGMTNREIAARLYLSERTAQNHVQHILTKLDLPNRSRIAVWVTSRR